MSSREKGSANGSERLGLGLVGCGGIGRLRAAAIDRLGSCRLAAVNDLDADRAAEVARRYGGQVEREWRDVLARDDVDAVIISTPPSLHAEMSIEASRARKHVLCEKPLARNPEECRAMVEAAERVGCLLATGFNYRFYPSVKLARQLFDSGAIGELDHIRSYAGYSAEEHSQAWLHDVDVMGGGALRDNGIHLIDLTHHFLGQIDTAKGYVSAAVWRFDGCEDNGFVLLRGRAGNVATLQASWTEFRGYRFEIELYGNRGFIRLRCFPMITEIVTAETPGQRGRRKRHLFPLVHLNEHLRSYRWVVTRSFEEEISAFQRSLRGERTSLATGYDGLIAVEIADAAGRGGSEVQIGRFVSDTRPQFR